MVGLFFSILCMFTITQKMDAFDMNNSQVLNHRDSTSQINDHMLVKYTAYNVWANKELAEWLSSASQEQLNKEIESSFSSLKKTVMHIWNAEYIWLRVIKDEPMDGAPMKIFDGDLEAMFEGWIEASEAFHQHISSMSESELKGVKANKGREGYTAISDMIHHCMNHSTYHRGQLITMGRQIGLSDPPRTDFIYYVGLQKE